MRWLRGFFPFTHSPVPLHRPLSVRRTTEKTFITPSDIFAYSCIVVLTGSIIHCYTLQRGVIPQIDNEKLDDCFGY